MLFQSKKKKKKKQKFFSHFFFSIFEIFPQIFFFYDWLLLGPLPPKTPGSPWVSHYRFILEIMKKSADCQKRTSDS